MIRELRALANILIRRFNLKPIDIEIKKVNKGRARYLTRKITLPLWALEGVKEFAYYYIIHEICHFIAVEKYQYHGHQKEFRTLEKGILKEYNIIPKYNRAYPKALYDLKGEKLCGDIGQKIKV